MGNMEPCHSGCKEVYRAWPSCGQWEIWGPAILDARRFIELGHPVGNGKYGALPFWMQGGLLSLAILLAMGNMEPCHSGCKEVYRAWPSCWQWEIWGPAILDARRFIELGHPVGNGKYGALPFWMQGGLSSLAILWAKGKYGALLFLIHGGLSSFGHPVGNGKYEALPFWMQGGL